LVHFELKRPPLPNSTSAIRVLGAYPKIYKQNCVKKGLIDNNNYNIKIKINTGMRVFQFSRINP